MLNVKNYKGTSMLGHTGSLCTTFLINPYVSVGRSRGEHQEQCKSLNKTMATWLVNNWTTKMHFSQC